MIWWLWTAYDPVMVHTFDVNAAWDSPDPDVQWLGECAWTSRYNNTSLQLR